MSVKITDLPSESSLSGSTIIYVVDPSGPTSYQSTLASVANFINTSSTSLATTTTQGEVIVPSGSGIKLSNTGAITINNVLHTFSFDANNNLIYTQNTNTSINLTTDGKTDAYATAELGTDQYAYSIDANGNLIATFSS